MADPTVSLHLGDCLDVLRTLDAGSVDCVVTDPPYGQTNEAYESGIAFNPELWAECYRVAKPGAALLSFAGSPTYHRIASAIEAGGWKVRQMWGWVYRNGFITSAWPKEGFDRLAPAMDPICFATKGKHLLSLEREGSERWRRDANSRGNQDYSGRASSHGATEAVGRWPRAIVAEPETPGFEYFALNPNNARLRADKTGHPNQKPLDVMVWLVGKLPGQIILDPFMGSGSTGAAALQLGKDFVGIERDPTWFAGAEQRLDAELAKTALFAAGGA